MGGQERVFLTPQRRSAGSLRRKTFHVGRRGLRPERAVAAATARGALGRVRPRKRHLVGEIVEDCLVQMPHRTETKMAKMRAQVVPQRTLARTKTHGPLVLRPGGSADGSPSGPGHEGRCWPDRPRYLARRAVDLLRGEVSGPVQRQQVVSGIEDQRFQRLAPRQLAENIAQRVPQTRGVHLVENLPHLRVAGNLPDAEQRLQVPIATTLVEGQQRGVVERKRREGRPQRVGPRTRRVWAPRIGDSRKAAAHQGLESVGRQMLANLPGIGRRGEEHGDSFRRDGRTSSLTQRRQHRRLRPMTERLFMAPVYENTSTTPPVFPGFPHRRELLMIGCDPKLVVQHL